MSSSQSEDEQDDNMFDQLKSIKAFTIDQLYLLHPDVGCPSTKPNGDSLQPNSASLLDQNLYEELVAYEQLRYKLSRLAVQAKHLHRKTFDHIDKVWVFQVETHRKIGMCQQGKIVETNYEYKQASIDQQQICNLELSFNELTEIINRDYIHYSFESQMKRHYIATLLAKSYQIKDEQKRADKLKLLIHTLVDFIRQPNDSKSDFVSQCRKWLRALILRFLEDETTDNFKFVMAQLSRGPPGTADWTADIIECGPYEKATGFQSAPEYISHCAALLTELFINLKQKIRRVTISSTVQELDRNSTEHNWSLIDPRFNCSEELKVFNSAGNNLSESDVIKLCLKIPVAQIFRAYVKKCLEPDELSHEGENNYEYIMLKLLTIGTIIIKTYQIGLETFNSIQYGNLIEYLSSQIRRTVIVLSDQWAEFKRRLKGIDNALFMRLQVEYDNFMLRSILIILELRQSGIWRHLSQTEPTEYASGSFSSNSWSADSLRPAFAKLLQVTGLTPAPTSSPVVELSETPKIQPARSSTSLTYEFSVEWFKEVSEPMLWHILWQFYHNAFVSSCDYHSDNYWLKKFREKSVVYLFVNKMRDSPPGECSYLLNSITSMVLSRSRQDSKLVSFIATEIFDLSFKQEGMREKMTRKGIRSLVLCAEKFPDLISLYVSYLVNEEVPEDIVDLFRDCSLSGWLCSDSEIDVIARWLIEYPISSVHNRVARLLISKLMQNSPDYCNVTHDRVPAQAHKGKKTIKKKECFIDLKTRRRFALLLYEASVHHLPETNDYGPQSLGTFVEVAFGSLFCERAATSQCNLIELAMDTNYQQLYVWIWRLLFTFRLHILNQPDTDWNDVQGRSGTSRSIKNTVIADDSFHPAPTIQDCECLSLSEGVKNGNSVALFINLMMTDITWQADTLGICLDQLNRLANSGHLTPSMMAMEYLTICHLSDLSGNVLKDQKCVSYFTTIITSSFEAARFASLIVSQLQRLKQYRQLQLSQFYISVLLEVAAVLDKQLSASWFSNYTYSLEKVACLLDYLVRFNFTTQRLEIVRKFYDCSYSIQTCKTTGSWIGSLFASNSLNASSTRREFLTISHVLTEKFKKYTWLRWVTAECDTLRLEKIWEDLVTYLSTNEVATLDMAIKKVCPQVNPTILKSFLPIDSWLSQIFDIVETDLSHPLCPLIWYNFFLNYFANSLNGVSVGLKLVPQETLTKLMTRLDSLFNYHLYRHKNWTSNGSRHQSSLAQLYRAYRLWLQDDSLQAAYVDIERLKDDYLVPLLKSVMESSTEGACLQYMDIQNIETQNRNLSQIWSTATHLHGNNLIKRMIFVENDQDQSMEILTSVEDEASDAVSLMVKADRRIIQEGSAIHKNVYEELKTPVQVWDDEPTGNVDEMIELVKRNFHNVFEESSTFANNMDALERTKSEIFELIGQLYSNKKRELVRVVPCADGHECTGPARIKLEVEEATIDDRKSECIQDRQRQCGELVDELLQLPSKRIVKSTILIENSLRRIFELDRSEKLGRTGSIIDSLLSWLSETNNYTHLHGSYHAANYLLKTALEVLSNTEETDIYNSCLVRVCCEHPGSVQVFSPHFSPSDCSSECFLSLYKSICGKQSELGSIAMFVLLSKFNLDRCLKNIGAEMHENFIKTTCSGLQQMGKQPVDAFTFGLLKRHIQIELAPSDSQWPEKIALVLSQFLEIMDDQTLAPDLWIDFMAILGLEKQASSGNFGHNSRESITNRSLTRQDSNSSETSLIPLNPEPARNETTTASFIQDITVFADRQTALDYNALNNLMQIISQFMKVKSETVNITLIELYKDYLDHFGVVLLSITFMWIRSTGDRYPDNHELIWRQYTDLWCHWVFLKKNCQNVSKTSFTLMTDYYVAALRYMINKMPDNRNQILQSIITDLAGYVKTTKEVVYLELTIFQRSLKNLPWSTFCARSVDFKNLAVLSEQENYNVSDLVSHILLQANLKDSLGWIQENDASSMPTIVEQLAIAIIRHSTYLKGFRLQGNSYTLIPIDRLSEITTLILPRMEYANLEHSQNNKLLVNLLRCLCIKLDDDLSEDSFQRSIIYAKFVSNYLVELIKNHPNTLNYHESYLYAVMDNSLKDLKLLASPDVEVSKKTEIYSNLLECCSDNAINEESRLLLAKSLVKAEWLKNRPIVVMEIFHSVGHIISDGGVLVYAIEKLIKLYLGMNGHYEKVWKSFSLQALSSNLYLKACVDERTPLAMLIYFEAQTRSSSLSEDEYLIQIWSSFLHWTSKLDLTESNELKLIVTWLRLMNMLEPHLQRLLFYRAPVPVPEPEEPPKKKEQIPTQVALLFGFLKQLVTIHDSNDNSGLLSYLRPTRTSTGRVIALALACFIADRALICLGETDNGSNSGANKSNNISSDPVREEVTKLRKLYLYKLEKISRKSNTQFLEAFIESINRSDKVQYLEGLQLLSTFVMCQMSVNDDWMSKVLNENQ